MICAHCAAGADLTTDPAPQIEAVRALAVEQHGKCPGGTWCDCQCVVVSLDEIRKRRAARGQDLPKLATTAAAAGLEPAGAIA